MYQVQIHDGEGLPKLKKPIETGNTYKIWNISVNYSRNGAYLAYLLDISTPSVGTTRRIVIESYKDLLPNLFEIMQYFEADGGTYDKRTDNELIDYAEKLEDAILVELSGETFPAGKRSFEIYDIGDDEISLINTSFFIDGDGYVYFWINLQSAEYGRMTVYAEDADLLYDEIVSRLTSPRYTYPVTEVKELAQSCVDKFFK